MPYLQGTSQESLCRWLDEGLNAFCSTCSVGHQIHTEFAQELARSFDEPASLQPLLDATRARRDSLLRESEAGRDRLLERHSHNALEGQHIIESLLEREDSKSLFAFTELLFDRMGIEQEYLDENLQLVRPTENLATGQLPGLDEEGVTATYDRATALSRDDVTFLTWEHPIVAETMNALLGSDVGRPASARSNTEVFPPARFCWRRFIGWSALHRVSCRQANFSISSLCADC